MSQLPLPFSSRLLSRIYEPIDRWLFTPAYPVGLPICRILFYAIVLFATRNMDYADWAHVPVDWFKPTITWKLLKFRVLEQETLSTLQTIFRIACAGAMLGLLTRLSILTALITGFYLLSLPGNFGKGNHGEAVLAITMFILLLSRSGDYFSIDWLIRLRRKKPNRIFDLPITGEYRWPIIAARMLLMIAFFCAGCSKLRIGGLEWITSDHFSHLMIEHLTPANHPPLESLTRWLAQQTLLCKFIAASVVIGQLSAPLALINKWFARIIVPALLLMQISIGLLLNVYFVSFIAMYIFWIPWFVGCDRDFKCKR